MKRKFLFVSTLLSVMVNNCFAFQTDNAQILKHREWVTNNKIETIYNKENSNELLKLQLNKHSFTQNNPNKIINALTRITETKISPEGYKVTINGNSILSIINHTVSTQLYKIDLQICTMEYPGLKVISCSNNEDQIAIESGANFHRGVTPTTFQIFPSAGKYVVDMTTSILNSSEEPLFISEDFQLITIPAA